MLEKIAYPLISPDANNQTRSPNNNSVWMSNVISLSLSNKAQRVTDD